MRKSKKNGKPELVLLDHGLYETLPTSVRLSLCKFWEAIVLRDQSKMDKYAKELNVDGTMKSFEILFITNLKEIKFYFQTPTNWLKF